jgi:hypothetical protein
VKSNSFVRYYPVFLVVSHIAVIALFIFLMKLPREVQIGFLILAGLDAAWAFHYRKNDDDPPCGAAVGDEPIARQRPRSEPWTGRSIGSGF